MPQTDVTEKNLGVNKYENEINKNNQLSVTLFSIHYFPFYSLTQEK